MHPVRHLLLALVCASSVRGEPPVLLQEVVATLTAERQRWAFTQVAREFDRGRLVLERVERYDPARGPAQRWQLLELNGRPPTDREFRAWSDRKNRVRKRPPKQVSEYVNLDQARVREETATTVSYEIPFRRSAGGLFPGEKVELTLTINKRTRGIERAQVNIDESFKVALGLAEVIDLDLDLALPGGDPTTVPAEPGDADRQPRGNASAVVSKFGRRIEYQWSEFTRHDAMPAAGRP